MKIALLLSRIEQTGVTTHTLDLAQGLIEKGHEVCLITGGKIENATDRVDHFYNAFVDLGVTNKRIQNPQRNAPQKNSGLFCSGLQSDERPQKIRPGSHPFPITIYDLYPMADG